MRSPFALLTLIVSLMFSPVLSTIFSPVALAQSESTIFTFPDGTTTANPFTLIADGKGNYFGTAIGGNGSVFELSPASGGGWTVTTIYEFPGGTGPYSPQGIVMDSAGNIYVACTDGPSGSEGSIVEFSPDGTGGWTEKTIFLFNGTNGRYPIGTLTLDSAGNLYGTTNVGGSCAAYSAGCGLAYKLTPQKSGMWRQTILYAFGAYTGDGQFPAGGLSFDSKGNLYGTTTGGGQTGCPNSNEYCGTVFSLHHTVSGWKEKILLALDITRGEYPSAAPLVDSAGNLYVTAYEGGPKLYGTVFELTPAKGGAWQFHMIHSFTSFTTGSVLVGGVTLDSAGNLFVATEDGGVEHLPCLQKDGTANGCGSVWEFSPTGTYKWTAKLLYVFTGGSDGSLLRDQKLVLESNGNIVGVAVNGGDSTGDGTIFELTP